jgi:hypothetical protein
LFQASGGTPVAATPPADPCPTSLQLAIDSTPTGGTLRLGSCTFHEAVTVDRAMTIVGPAVIDGDNLRPTWMTVHAGGVTVDGLTMRNAAAGAAQSGSLDVENVLGFTLRNATLSGGSYADLRLWNGSGYRIEASDVGTARAVGIIAWEIGDSTVSGNRLHDNNTAGFDPGYEAGGIKLGRASQVTISANEVDGNTGPGIWCDVACTSVTVNGNRVHDNTRQGILFETGLGASITGNAVWENGWSFPSWGWGGGIVISSSGGADVAANTVAWNADGIVVISQNRSDAQPVTDNHVHDNVVGLAPQPGDGDDAYAFAWLADWSSPMFDHDAGNGGTNNAVSLVGAGSDVPFAWGGGTLSDPGAFGATPGGTGLRMLDPTDARQLLTVAGVPTGPVAQLVHRPLTRSEVILRVAVGAVLAGLVVLLILGAVLLRRRRRARAAAISAET